MNPDWIDPRTSWTATIHELAEGYLPQLTIKLWWNLTTYLNHLVDRMICT